MKNVFLTLLLATTWIACKTSQSSTEKTVEAPAPYSIIEDKDFEMTWKTKIIPFLEQGHKGYFAGQDGKQLEYFSHVPVNPKADVVLVHGFSQNYRAFGELMYNLAQNGYAVHAYSQISHGCSEHLLLTPEQNKQNLAANCAGLSTLREGKTYYSDPKYLLVHLDSYKRAVNDLSIFVQKVRTPARKTYLFCHSMGGGVCARAIQDKPDLVDATFLHAPMIRAKAKSAPYAVETAAISVMARFNAEGPAPGQKEVAYEDQTFETGAEHLSRMRFDAYNSIVTVANGRMRNGGTVGVLNQLVTLSADVNKPENLAKISMPVFIVTAGPELDNWVDVPMMIQFCNAIKICRYRTYTAAKHEAYLEPDTIRLPLVESVLDFYANPMGYIEGF